MTRKVFFCSVPSPGLRVYTLLSAWRHDAQCLLPADWGRRVVLVTETRAISCQIHDDLDGDWVEVQGDVDLGEALDWLCHTEQEEG